MKKEDIEKSVKEAREKGKKRNFQQKFDFIINLKNFDLKDTEKKVEIFLQLKYGIGKKKKICALVSQELVTDAKNCCDHVILDSDFEKLKDEKKQLKKLVREYDCFVAEAKVMPKLASTLGRFLGPKGKMPNPKSGSVLKSKTDVKPTYDRLQNFAELKPKNEPILRCTVGSEGMNDGEIAENILHVYNTVLSLLPQESENVKSALLKLTMGKPVYLFGGKDESKGNN